MRLASTVFPGEVNVKPQLNTELTELRHLSSTKCRATLARGLPVDTRIDDVPLSLELSDSSCLAEQLLKKPIDVAARVTAYDVA